MADNISIEEWSGSKATKELEATIAAFNEQNTKNTKAMLRLTRVIAFLTVVLVIGLGVQIYIALQQTPPTP